MSTRIGKPDTDADCQLRNYLDQPLLTNFVMVAGAGSGKTTSLVKALDHLAKTRGSGLKKRGQKVACITYTEVAEREIWADVGNDPFFQISTIHSFLWTIVKSFQEDIRTWVVEQITKKVETKLEKSVGAKAAKRPRGAVQQDVLKLDAQPVELPKISRFTYGAGSDYQRGVLGHADIIKMVSVLIQERPLFRTLVARRFPFVFVDESQDTDPDVVNALKAVAADSAGRFCLGFFGDPMQKIYLTGIGEVGMQPGWVRITKPENFRCSDAVRSVINKIRADGDGLVQTHGRTNQGDAARGTSRIFVLPRDEHRDERLSAIRSWLAKTNEDPAWMAEGQSGVRILVVVHRMAAKRLGFDELYAALNDKASDAIRNGFLDGTTWVVSQFLTYILPLAEAAGNGRDFDVMSLLRANCSLLAKEDLVGVGVPELIHKIRRDIARLVELLSADGAASVREVLQFVDDCGLANLNSRLVEHLHSENAESTATESVDDDTTEESRESRTMAAYLKCPAKQLWGYRSYIEDESPFFTQQGVKGAEFARVLTVVDDEESSHRSFSYDKYFGIAQLSDTDRKNQAERKETVVDRTRRLFYVCCSRAVQDLAVVVFAQNILNAAEKISEMGLFPSDQVYVATVLRTEFERYRGSVSLETQP